MSNESIFQEYKIKSLNDLFNFCEKFKYGWVDKDGTKHIGGSNNKEYSLQSPELLLDGRLGICWDQTELHRAFLEQKGYNPETFLLYYYISDNNCPSHSIITYQKDDRIFWFEPMFKDDQTLHGIHAYDSESELLKTFIQRWTTFAIEHGILPDNINPAKYSLYKYKKPKYGINDEEFYSHCRTGSKIDVMDLLNLKPNNKEQKALTLFYNRFYNLYDEILDEAFMVITPETRFTKLKELFAIYSEIISYEPIKYHINWMKNGGRPRFDGIISDELFKFIRNLFAHYPIFDKWDVYIDKDLATWNNPGKSIDGFLKNCGKIRIDDKPTVKYRIWEYEKQKMSYFSVNFPEPSHYETGKKIYLKDILKEYVGTKFCVAQMRKVVDVNIENPEPPKIDIMSQVYVPKV